MGVTIEQLLATAKERRASDLHISVGIRPKCRINGVLHEMEEYDILSPEMAKTIIESMFKPYQQATINEKGEVDFAYNTRELGRFRVNAFRQRGSYAAVIRIVETTIPSVTKLGLPWSTIDLTKKKRGLVLVTGPTGSGKSTTLYTELSEINSDDVNIITVEDPVEYTLEGINQVNVNSKAGMTFASALRSILRQDPDVIMIGEIRDNETAEIAIKAAITGHLVMSTLHTNDAASSVTRLIDMGVEPFLASTSLTGIIAQRLVRRICPYCKEEYEASSYEKKILRQPEDKPLKIYKGKGCGRCHNSGYYGRVGLYEVMEMDRELKDAINSTKDPNVLKDIARKNGMTTLEEECIKHVLEGLTTVKELATIAMIKEG